MKRNEIKNWKVPSFGEHNPSPLDWARLAAFIDGEGSILINTQKSVAASAPRGHFYLRVTVANTDVIDAEENRNLPQVETAVTG